MSIVKRIAALLVLAFASTVALADEARGIISSIDNERQELVLLMIGHGAHRTPLTFIITPETQVTAANQASKLSDLRNGQRARISFELHDGRRVATAVSVRTLLGLMNDVTRPENVAGKKSGESPLASAPADPSAITGVLQRVSSADREVVTVGPSRKGDGEVESTINVPTTAAITRDGKSIPFEDLKEGLSVTVHADSKEGKLIARDVELGKTAVKPPADVAKSDRIEKIRRILKIVDALLEQKSAGGDKP